MFDIAQAIALELGGSDTGVVTPSIPSKVYEVVLSQPSNLVIHLDGLSSDADLKVKDVSGEVLSMGIMSQLWSANLGRSSEHIDAANTSFPEPVENPMLQSGTYYVEVALKQGSNETPYRLVVDAADSPGIMDAGVLGDLSIYRGGLGVGESKEYHFELEEGKNLMFFLTSADEAEMELSVDSTVATLEVNSPMKSYSLKKELEVGSYTLKVENKDTKDVHYVVAVRNAEFNPMM